MMRVYLCGTYGWWIDDGLDLPRVLIYLRAELGGSGTILDLVLVLSAGKGGAEYRYVS